MKKTKLLFAGLALGLAIMGVGITLLLVQEDGGVIPTETAPESSTAPAREDKVESPTGIEIEAISIEVLSTVPAPESPSENSSSESFFTPDGEVQ